MFFAVLSFILLVAARPAAAVPAVVASIAPVHSAAAAVMDGIGTPELLLNPAVSVHDYHLKPSDMRRLSRADVLFWGGAQLESFLEKPIEAAGLTDKNVALMSDSRLTILPARGGRGATADGHFWLMPENMAQTARIIAEKLASLDPENAAAYKKNAEDFARQTAELEKAGRQKLAPFAGTPYVTFHDAYQYFEKSFGLTPVGSVYVDSHHASGIGRMAELREKMRRAGRLCLFSEPQFSDKGEKTVAQDLPVATATLDPVGAELTAGKGFYGDLMNALFDSFAGCFSKLREQEE